MLHRTRASQVVPAYLEFIEEFPTLQSIASASDGDVLTLFAPLGLRWRARLAADLLRSLSRSPGAVVPTSRQVLRELPGVGEYIAGAIACFSTNQPEVILDTNIVRVLGRLSGTRVTDGSRRSVQFKRRLEQLVPRGDPKRFYFALIDLAALVCTPTSPRCPACPLNFGCEFNARARRLHSGKRLARPRDTVGRSRLGSKKPRRIHESTLVSPVESGGPRAAGEQLKQGAHRRVRDQR